MAATTPSTSPSTTTPTSTTTSPTTSAPAETASSTSSRKRSLSPSNASPRKRPQTTSTTSATASTSATATACPTPRQLSTRPSCYAENAFPLFTKPSIKLCFSVSGDRVVINDRSNLHFLARKQEDEHVLDLESGRDNALNVGVDRDEGLSLLLTAILANKESAMTCEQDVWRVRADFVCFRGLLTKILTSPYESEDSLTIVATKWRQTIFMMANDSVEETQRRKIACQRGAHCVFWGYRFESLMLADEPNGKPNPDTPVDANEEFCCVFASHLGSHALLYGAEMDGVEVVLPKDKKIDKNELDLNKDVDFVELKTSRRIDHARQLHNFQRRKLLKWWAQSFLVGVQRIICGFRDDKGKIEPSEIQEKSVKRIHSDCRGLWSGSVCMSFLDEFLTAVKSSFENKDDLVVNSFHFDPRIGSVEMVTDCKDVDAEFIVPCWFQDQDKWEDFLKNSSLLQKQTQ